MICKVRNKNKNVWSFCQITWAHRLLMCTEQRCRHRKIYMYANWIIPFWVLFGGKFYKMEWSLGVEIKESKKCHPVWFGIMAPREPECVSIYHLQDKHLAFEMKQESLQKCCWKKSLQLFFQQLHFSICNFHSVL